MQKEILKNYSEYFNEAYKHAQGFLCLCAIPEERSKLLIQGIFSVNELDKMLEKTYKMNGKYHLYCNIHPIKERPQTGRGKEKDILGVALMACDVDAKDFIVDPEESMKSIAEKGDYKWSDELLIECKTKALEKIHDTCNEVGVTPSAVIDSGHGFYPIFFLNEFVEFKNDKHREEIKENNRILHKALSADATFDFTRILRIPGTRNLKAGYPADCKLIEFNPSRRYTIDDIRKFEKITEQPSLTAEPTHRKKSETKENKKATPDRQTEIDLEPVLKLVSFETRSMIKTGKWDASKKTKDGKTWSRSERDQCVVARLRADGASYEEVKSVFQKFACGDKFRETNNGERYLKRSWDRVSTDKEEGKKDKKPKFRATPLAMELCRNRNENLAFVTEQDQFYGYKDGVWKIIEGGYVEKAIRDLIRQKFTDWDTQAKRNEVLSALKDYLTSWESRDRFALGINPNLQMINVLNGMLDWETGKLKDHAKEYYSTCQLDVTYNEEAKSELWEKCLIQWIPDKKTRLFLQEFSGYCLIPDTKFHKAVILVGAGSNGKSTFLFTNEKLFGDDNLSSIPMKKLSERFEIARIQHKLVNICADIESGYIEHTSNIKKIITGDTLRGELKYKPSFDFTPITRLWFSCNEIPKASDRSEAWYRRFEYVTFPRSFEGDGRDTQLKLKLTTEEVLSAVLNWALVGLRRLNDQGEFTISDQMVEAKEDYELDNDNVAAFIDDMLEFPVDNNVPKQWIYEQYKDYCKESGTKALAKKRFERRIVANGFDEIKTSVKVCSLHRNFRCNLQDHHGNFLCESDDTEWAGRACFVGLDFRD